MNAVMTANERHELLKAVWEALKAPFEANDHDIRDLPGRGQWIFLKWQKYRDRLDEVVPDWQISYSNPVYSDDKRYCMIKATMAIAGVTREAWGTVEAELISSSGKDMARGNPVDRAVAEAFKNCAEAFGVASYLDDQHYTLKIVAKGAVGELAEKSRKYAQQLKIQIGFANAPKVATPQVKESILDAGISPRDSKISATEIQQFWTATSAAKLDTGAVKTLLANYGYNSIQEVKKRDLPAMMSDLEREAVADKPQHQKQKPNSNQGHKNSGQTVNVPSNQPIQTIETHQNPNDSTADLYPNHNRFISALTNITKHSVEDVSSYCLKFGVNKLRPGLINPDEMKQLTRMICIDWAVDSGLVQAPAIAYQSYEEYLAFRNDLPWSKAAISWVEGVKSNMGAIPLAQ